MRTQIAMLRSIIFIASLCFLCVECSTEIAKILHQGRDRRVELLRPALALPKRKERGAEIVLAYSPFIIGCGGSQ